MDDTNIGAHIMIIDEINPLQEHINNVVISPDYSSDILVLQGVLIALMQDLIESR
jgi:hypothetical protein